MREEARHRGKEWWRAETLPIRTTIKKSRAFLARFSAILVSGTIKSEARNPKSETISKLKMIEISKRGGIFIFKNFCDFGNLNLFRVSSFGIRVSQRGKDMLAKE